MVWGAGVPLVVVKRAVNWMQKDLSEQSQGVRRKGGDAVTD